MTEGIFSNKNISKINNRSLIISVNRKSALLENLVKWTWRYSFLIDRNDPNQSVWEEISMPWFIQFEL